MRAALTSFTYIPHHVVVALVVEEVVVEAARGLGVEALPPLRVLPSLASMPWTASWRKMSQS